MGWVLVTGGAGYVGARLVPKLLEADYRVRVLDLFLFLPEVLAPFEGNSSLEIVKGDVRDKDLVDQCLNDVDTVIHLAAISNDPSGELNPLLTRTVNYDATCHLVERAKSRGVRRFIFASSASVYGFAQDAVSEDHALNPKSVYAQSKALAEAVVCAANAPDYVTVVTRAATLCGFSPRMRLDLVVNAMVYQALHEGRILVNGGEQERPLLAVGDLVHAYSLLLTADAGRVAGRVFNIGGGNYRIADIANTVCQTLATRVTIHTAPTVDVRSYAISSERFRLATGFSPRLTLADAIREIREGLATLAIDDSTLATYNNALTLAKLRV